jgi:hypothetical protein
VRNRQAGVGLLLEIRGQAIRFPAEQKPVVRAEAETVVALRGMAAEGDQAAAPGSLVGQEGREIRMQRKRHQGPIVEAGSAQLTVINLKSQRFNQV